MNIQKLNRDFLPLGIREAVRDLRFNARYGNPTEFHNNENLLPPAGKGNTYFEHDVNNDRNGGRGKFRIVALVSSGGKLLNLYFTSAHYSSEWTEIV